jgi:RNA polymerase sigma factor (sigma-70 family)
MRTCSDFGHFAARIENHARPANLARPLLLRHGRVAAPSRDTDHTAYTRPPIAGCQATFWPLRSFQYVDIADAGLSPGAAAAVTTLYAEHALGLVRLAVVLTGDRGAAEDIVQDAFLGLFRRWDHLADTTAPLAYLRVSVLNGCRTALRRRSRLWLGATADFAEAAAESADSVSYGGAAGLAESAETRALLGDEQRAVAAALRKLPRRQREAVVLRYYLDLSEAETAQAMQVSRGTVKSATHRGLAAVGRTLREGS